MGSKEIMLNLAFYKKELKESIKYMSYSNCAMSPELMNAYTKTNQALKERIVELENKIKGSVRR